MGLLISAIEKHMKNAKVVKNACLALASLVEPDGKMYTAMLLYKYTLLTLSNMERKVKMGNVVKATTTV